MDKIYPEEIKKQLPHTTEFNIVFFENIDSTNVYLKNLAKKGEIGNTIVIADSQTDGHGRFERKFFSPQNCGIYMSILLKPDLPADKSIFITVATAVAVCEAIESLTNLKPSVKWVNDILIDGKKVCGILTEGAINSSLKLDWAVVGIGINVYFPKNNFDPQIENIATSLLKEEKENFRNNLCAQIINRLYSYVENIESKAFLQKYKEYSCVLNKKINVIKNDKTYPATVLEIDDDCRLKVEFEDGKTEFLNSGEISIKL